LDGAWPPPGCGALADWPVKPLPLPLEDVALGFAEFGGGGGAAAAAAAAAEEVALLSFLDVLVSWELFRPS
jgi:hypothetical protein